MPPVAILAGGLATRLYPITRTIPKSMLPIAGKPFIEHQLTLLKQQGIERVIICTGFLGDQIMDYIGDGSRFDMNIDFSFDGDRLLGTGGALRKALPLLGDLFFIMYGDSYLDTCYRPILEYFLSAGKQALMTVYKNENRWDKSNILYSDGRIIKYDKKNPTPDMQYIDYGLGLMKKEALESIPEDSIFDLADLYEELVERDEMAGFEVDRRFYEIGSKRGVKETDRYLKNRIQNKGKEK